MPETSLFKQHQEKCQNKISLNLLQAPKNVKVTTLDDLKAGNVYKELSLQKLQGKFGFSWCEGFAGPATFIRTIAGMMPQDPPDFLNRLAGNAFATDFAVAEIDDKVGHGLVYVGENPIPADTYVALYTGELKERVALEEHYPYLADGCDSRQIILPDGSDCPLFAENPKNPMVRSCIDAQDYGNLSRFMLSLPDQDTLDDYEFALELSRDQIACANLNVILMDYNGLPFKILVTNREIRKGPVGYDYGDDYFNSAESKYGTKRLLFYKDSSVVPSHLYRSKKIVVNFIDHNAHENFSVLGVQQAKMRVFDNEPEKIYTDPAATTMVGEIAVDAIKEALIANKHSPLPTVKSIEDYQHEVTDNDMLDSLRKFVHDRFKCYHRKPHDIIDAVFTANDEKELISVIAKLYGVGLFAKIVDNSLIIEAVNCEHTQTALLRLTCRYKNIYQQPSFFSLTREDQRGFFRLRSESHVTERILENYLPSNR